jgi:diguanylate cyclase (GGDEF)-like protein/PAS domain S-box-containing protein
MLGKQSRKGDVIEVNEALCHITGFSQPEINGQILGLLRSKQHAPEFFTALWHDLETTGHWFGEIWDQRKNGDTFAALVTMSAVWDALRKVQNYVVLFSDITHIKNHQQQLEYAAHYDALTRLPNRLLLADRLCQALAQTQRRDCLLAVIFLDLDGFKAVNDQYGHDVGDELLIELSKRILNTLRDGDTLARMGGDEFVAVVTDLHQPEDCVPILDRLLSAAADPIQIGNSTLQVSASIGVTYFPEDYADTDQLLRHADQAMYLAKQTGKNRYHVFDINQDASDKTQHENSKRIQMALSQG